MIFTDKLDILMRQRGLTRGSLAAKTGVPYNTIVGFYTKGYKNSKLSNLRRLSEFFGVSLDVLCDDDRELFQQEEREAAPDIIKKYSALSKKGQSIVESLIDGLADMESPESVEENSKITKLEYIREYVTPAAAGYASPAEGDDYVLVPRGSDVPRGADFAVRIAGDSMEPYIKDGSRVYVSRMSGLIPGDVGIFFVDGDMKCKQYCEDSEGNIYLFSANRERSDADMTIPASSGMTVVCFGKVLLGVKIPLPGV
ncbi:MAG: XRE family transcriptional regulator [Oscillospiraceae bacterium]